MDEVIAFRAGEAVSAGHFFELAKALSLKLPKHRYVFNMFKDRFEYLLAFCASTIAGQCTLMPPNRLHKTLDQLAEKYPDSYFIDNLELFVRVDDKDGSGYQGGDVPLIPDEQLCAIAFTSGSTGEPNPNPKYWETLRVATLGNARLMLNGNDERINMVATVPPQHLWGMETSILLPLLSNVSICDLTPFYPQDIADALASVPSPRALISSPAHLNVLLKSGVRLVELDRIYSATAPMSQDVAIQLEQQFGTRVLEVFGCSESGILAGRRTSTESLWHLSELFELELQKEGVLIKAPHLPGDVLLPDMIELVGNDRFKWLGRHHDMVNIAGKRGSLTDLNRQLIAIDGVTDGVIFQPDDDKERLAAMVVSRDLGPDDILKQLKSVVDTVFLPRPIHLVNALPRQETGKLPIGDVLNLYRQVIRDKKSLHL